MLDAKRVITQRDNLNDHYRENLKNYTGFTNDNKDDVFGLGQV
jgi:hypothetical protein